MSPELVSVIHGFALKWNEVQNFFCFSYFTQSNMFSSGLELFSGEKKKKKSKVNINLASSTSGSWLKGKLAVSLIFWYEYVAMPENLENIPSSDNAPEPGINWGVSYGM